ncbi:MAG: hypothetical protein K8L99_20715 [Anaerolineae bacterium]|nr:hypothetical protein [Anaerolineae bacterium]
MMRDLLLGTSDQLYQAIRQLLFRLPAQEAHERILDTLTWLDAHDIPQHILRLTRQQMFPHKPVSAGEADLPFPMMLAAGFVKGTGFETEAAALQAVANEENIIPGWRTMPALVGPIEYGSYTRWPRLGNPGTVIWRDAPNRSLQNRVGLKNPGAKAAAAFLTKNRIDLPPVFGINIAVSPGVDDPQQTQQEVLEAIRFFVYQGVVPTWFTLNISCPNTEDDPGSRQTEAHTRQLCRAVTDELHDTVPLWVKISPDLAPEQYQVLLRVFEETGVKAVIASNTLAQPAPNAPGVVAGVAGARLHVPALQLARQLMCEKSKRGYTLDVVGCGGIQDGLTLQNYFAWGIRAVQYWSALIFRGPLAAAYILREAYND